MKFQSDKTGTALYFPNFVPDEGWLKTSLLYWDRVRRIVPKSAELEVLHTDPVHARHADDAGLLIQTDCTSHLKKTASLFDSQIKPLLHRNESEIANWLSSEGKKTRLHEGKFGEIQRSWLHNESFLHPVASDFVERGLFKRKGDFFQMPKVIGDLYITCLASEMSHPLGTPLITDDAGLCFGSEQLVYADRSFSGHKGMRATAMQRVGIHFPHPEHLRKVSWKSFLAFHAKFGQERIHFRTELETFVTMLAKAKSREMQEDLCAAKKKELERLMKDHRGRLKTIGVAGAWAYMTLTIPKAVEALTAFVSPESLLSLKIAGLAFGTANAWAKTSKEYQDSKNANPWHYSVRLQRKFR